jgi:hypothetical protein
VIAAAGETATTAAGTTTALTAHNPANTLTATLQAFERYGVTPSSPSRRWSRTVMQADAAAHDDRSSGQTW